MIDRTPTIFVVPEFKRDSKIESYWYECFHDDDFHDWDVRIVDGTFIGNSDSFLYSDTYYKSIQLRSIMDLINRKQVHDGDIFVFANAWNYAAIPLSYFRDEFQMNIHIIGVWGDSLFNQQSPMWHRFKGKSKQWGRQVELALFNAYDMNCFLSEEHWQMFQRKFGNLKGSYKNKWSGQVMSRYSITGYPFGYLEKESYYSTEKKDVIIFPYSIHDDIQRDIFQGLKTELPQYTFAFAQKEFNNRLLYHGLLKDAKTMFCAEFAEYNPVLLYEAMLSGVFPMVPDNKIYQQLFPEYYRYPLSIPKFKYSKSMYLLRNRHQLKEYVMGIMDSYDILKISLLRDARTLTKRLYRNDLFKQMLIDVAGRPPKHASAKVRKKYRRQQIDQINKNNEPEYDMDRKIPPPPDVRVRW